MKPYKRLDGRRRTLYVYQKERIKIDGIWIEKEEPWPSEDLQCLESCMRRKGEGKTNGRAFGRRPSDTTCSVGGCRGKRQGRLNGVYRDESIPRGRSARNGLSTCRYRISISAISSRIRNCEHETI